MIYEDDNGFPYFSSFDDIRAEGYTPIKVWSLLQFFTLAGRKTVLAKDNFIPFPDLKYIVKSQEKEEFKFYVRDYRNYDVDTLFFYRKSLIFSGDDEGVESLRRYVDDERVWLILTNKHIIHTQDLLKRLYKSYFSNEGKIDYRVYISIVEWSLKLEDYRDYGRDLVGFKTTCKIMSERITALWKTQYKT